jgi:hypothetical protein
MIKGFQRVVGYFLYACLVLHIADGKRFRNAKFSVMIGTQKQEKSLNT